MEGKIYEVEFDRDFSVLIRHVTEQAPTCDDGAALGGKKDIPKSLMLERALNWIRSRGLRITSVIKHREAPFEAFWIVTEPIVEIASSRSREFVLGIDQAEKARAWVQEHVKTCTVDDPQVAYNRITFTFSETGVGLVAHIVCFCGQRCDVTDYDSF